MRYLKYRSRSEIVAQILVAASEIEGVTKTRIMFQAFLSFNQLKDYLAMLTNSGLLEYDPQTKKYKTADKGMQMLETYRKINDLVGARNA